MIFISVYRPAWSDASLKHAFTVQRFCLAMTKTFYNSITLCQMLWNIKDTRAGRFGWKQIRFDSAEFRFDSLLLRHSGPKPFMSYMVCIVKHLLAKLLTVICLRLAINALWCKYESKKHFEASFLIFFHDLKSCMLCDVLMGINDRIEPRWFSICHTESIRIDSPIESIIIDYSQL